MQLSPLGEVLTKYAQCTTDIFKKCSVKSIVPGPSGFRVLTFMKSFSFIMQFFRALIVSFFFLFHAKVI